MTQITPEFSRPVNVDRLPRRATDLAIVAEEAERLALARRFGVLAIESLSATVSLKPISGSRMVRLRARLSSDVVQTCIVTLDPLAQHVEEEFELTYGPPETAEDPSEVAFSYEDADPPEPIHDGIIDIGEAVAEHLALALDPFPRTPGAICQDTEAGGGTDVQEDDKPNPFAALAALKKKKD